MISFTPAEGAVVRGLAMEELPNGASIMIDIEPRDSSRRVEVVARQLDRLVDVNSISILTAPQASPS